MHEKPFWAITRVHPAASESSRGDGDASNGVAFLASYAQSTKQLGPSTPENNQ
jgi:hypothetical protein